MLAALIANNEDVAHLCPTKITDMSEVFNGNTTFNQDLGSWDVSNVTDMSFIFYGADDFNQDLSSRSVTNVTGCPGFHMTPHQGCSLNQILRLNRTIVVIFTNFPLNQTLKALPLQVFYHNRYCIIVIVKAKNCSVFQISFIHLLFRILLS